MNGRARNPGRTMRNTRDTWSFTADMRARRGVCDGIEVIAGALPWLVAGHERHHLDVLRDRYGLGE